MTHNLTYGDYLQLDALLSLQSPTRNGPHTIEHDELLFIIIHQVYELWFKEILHELEYVQARLRLGDTPRATHTLRRILTILKITVSQVDILETMTPLEFNSFRGFLETASGFQSAQFREIEFMLGHKRANILNHYADDPAGLSRLRTRYAEATLWDAFLHYLHCNGHPIPAEHLNRDVTAALKPSEEIQAILIDVYRSDPESSNVCERLVDIDEGLQEWRYRHVKMVERTIGMKTGTGGSSGVQYLAATIKSFFPDLWIIRSQL
ncbi:MAG: tryptophan 2,3-dioxygenase family protein [Chloroflexales bacterium]|nr:tryptophan 2,3-dioxygenase family protein [Chloroflexales bacterium]